MRHKKNFIVFLFFGFLVFLLLWWFWATGPVCSDHCQNQIFVISRGEGVGRIAQRLEQEGLIRSSVAFQILVAKESLGKKMQAGDFRLNPSRKPEEIMRNLTHGTLDVWVTLLEGWRREEMAEELAASLGVNFQKTEFLSLTVGLEGKLFPDTYLLPKDAQAEQVVSVLSRNFEKRTADLIVSRKTLILASLVEREAKMPEDRPIVAGILLKRLERGWPLQIDATIQYVVASAKCKGSASRQGGQSANCEWWPKELTREDMAVKSPYNTYLAVGLPSAPISSPGLSSLQAVLNPAQSDYWFYLSDKDGKIHYGKTLGDHQRNINSYLK